MKIKQGQDRIKEIFGEIEHPRLASFIALTEEVGEVADEIMKKEIYEETFDLESLKGEMADVLVSLFELANVYEIDLEAEFIRKIENLESRAEKWKVQLGDLMYKKRKKIN